MPPGNVQSVDQKLAQFKGAQNKEGNAEGVEENEGAEMEEGWGEDIDAKEAAHNSSKQKDKKKKGALAKLKDKAKKVISPLMFALAKFLQWATSLAGIKPTFGLSLLYLYIHAYLVNIFPDVFCKLGEERFIKRPGPITKKEEEQLALGRRSCGLVMKMFIGLSCLGCFLYILYNLIIIAVIMDFIENPLGALLRWARVGLGWIFRRGTSSFDDQDVEEDGYVD